MSPRARRSESITLPPGNYPNLIRYKDDKDYEYYTGSEKHIESVDDDDFSESDLDEATDPNYSNNTTNNNSYESLTSLSVATKPSGR